jgi:hypothetical protein
LLETVPKTARGQGQVEDSLPGTTRSAVRFIVSIPCSVRGMSEVPVYSRLGCCMSKKQPDEMSETVANPTKQVDGDHQRQESVSCS